MSPRRRESVLVRTFMRSVAFLLLVACSNAPEVSSTDAPGEGPDPGDTRLLPLAVGTTWIYDVVSTYPSCPAGVREQSVIGTGEIDGRSTFRVRGFCGLEGETHIDGDRVEDHYDWGPLGWTRMLDEPVEDGHAWSTTNGSATFGMHYEGAGEMARGAECWTVVQEVSYTSTWTYCRGVGLVRYEMIDLGGGTIRAELRAR